MDDKAAIRARMKMVRELIDDRLMRSVELWAALAELPEYRAASTVMAFNGFKSEPDTDPLFARIAAEGKRLLLPRIEDGRIVERGDGDGDVGLERVVIGPVQEQYHARPIPSRQHRLHALPTRAHGVGVGRQRASVLIAIGREMVHAHRRPVCAVPAECVGGGMGGATRAAPHDGDRKSVAGRNGGECRRMPEGVGAIGDGRRRGAESTQHAATRFEIPQDRLARRDQIIGEHEPRTGLERSRFQPRAQRRLALGAHGEVIQEGDCLPIEEKRLVGGMTLEDAVEERDQPLPEPCDGVVPLAVPMGMGHHIHVERGRVAGRRGRGVHGGKVSLLPTTRPVTLRG